MAKQGFLQGLLDDLNNLSTATETYELPSKGRLDGIDANVTLRIMTTHEEKIRTGSRGNLSFFKLIGSIINNCIVEPKNIDVYQLTVPDFIFLMYKLRIISYGKDYKVNLTTCPYCERKLSNVTIDLDTLPFTSIDDMEGGKDFTEPFYVNLPKTKWKVGLRMLRMHEFDEIQEEASSILEEFPTYKGDPAVILRLCRQIVSINDEKVSIDDLKTIVDKLPAIDENKIVNKINSINYGLNLESVFVCPHCGKSIKIPLAFTEEFFRPSLD